MLSVGHSDLQSHSRLRISANDLEMFAVAQTSIVRSIDSLMANNDSRSSSSNNNNNNNNNSHFNSNNRNVVASEHKRLLRKNSNFVWLDVDVREEMVVMTTFCLHQPVSRLAVSLIISSPGQMIGGVEKFRSLESDWLASLQISFRAARSPRVGYRARGAAGWR